MEYMNSGTETSNGVGVSTPSSSINKNGTEVPTPEKENDETAPKGIHFDKASASDKFIEIKES